jgi:5-methylcytosine-specific restriction endonuclease McrA
MPRLPGAQCAEYGCKLESVRGSIYCKAHAPAVTVTEARERFNAPYKSQAWGAIRARTLSASPLCEACKACGRITAATHVDHVFPWQVFGRDAFIRNSFQSLCPECHGVKSGNEKRGIFRHYATGRDYSAADYPAALVDLPPPPIKIPPGA